MEMNGHSGAEVVDLLGDPHSAALVRLCDPGNGLESEDEFKNVWVAVRSAVEGL
jgi:hypothetical protein